LALFNLLKAYSLLDKDVGYCQGLSFVAGILLMHVGSHFGFNKNPDIFAPSSLQMPEERAFQTMKYMMFQLGFRRQYRPDMIALQVEYAIQNDCVRILLLHTDPDVPVVATSA
jgi:hypothetical protein